MDNEKARKILYEAIDGEASKMEREELAAHLSENAPLKARFDFEKRFRDFVAGADSTSEAEVLPQNVRASILAKLDEIDNETLATESPEFENTKRSPLNITQKTRSFSPRYGLAMAASFVLMVVGIGATVLFFQHETAFGSFENAHHAARNLGDDFPSESEIDATSFIAQNFGIGLTEDLDGLSLCGGEVVKLDNSEFAHFKFCDDNDEPVSIFVGSAKDYTLPEMPSTVIAGKQYFNHDCPGCKLRYWRSGDALIVAASTPDDTDDRPISSLVHNAGADTDGANSGDQSSESSTTD